MLEMKFSPMFAAALMAAGAVAPAHAETCPLSQTAAVPRMHVATETPTIVAAAAANPDFSTLVAAVKAAGLVETLSGKGPFTVFAPTNEAFAKLPAGTVEELLKPENKAKLVAVLTYHVVAGKVESDAAMKLAEAKSVQGSAIPLKVVDGALTVGGAKVVKADLQCANGVIHVIDRVIMPPTGEPAKQPATIVEAAVANEDFSTLVAAVKAAGLVETLTGEGPFTVFAPTNAAFAKLPEGTVAGLLKPEAKDQLAKVLTYHVVAGKVMAADVVKIKEAETVQGGKLAVKAGDDGVMINNARVIKADIECGNGVIHVIDAVLLPRE
jgi:transforming growth factor-beta-induced protein